MSEIETQKMLSCVGFIMDGNRRFAKEQGQSELQGHIAGKDKFLEVIDWVKEMKIPHVVFYAFSTENWKRSEEEVGHLMSIFRELLQQIKNEKEQQNFNIKIIGKREDLPIDIQKLISDLESDENFDNDKVTVWVTISYGGRAEIISAINKAFEMGVGKVDEEMFSKLLWTKNMPDPDLIIRTSGEKRLSNFLPWQSVYSELFFIPTYWPAFTKSEFMSILEEYKKRDRRIGK